MPVILNCGAKLLLFRDMSKKKALMFLRIKTIKFFKCTSVN